MSGALQSFKVVAKRQESRLITSFELEPLQDWPGFRPGQFLVFRLAEGLVRSYSLSGCPDRKGPCRITVKREGVGSSHLHDCVALGDIVQAEGPRGAFVLNEDSPRPVVLLAGGVGLTPLLSMLHRLAQGQRRTLFLHAVENGADHPLRDEVLELCQGPQMTAHFLYRAPTDEDRAEHRFHSEGLISKALLQRLLPLDDYEFYICGPLPFMQACHALLHDLGVPRDRIADEAFGPGLPRVAPSPTATAATQGERVTFRASGLSAAWDDSANLLDFAEAQGLTPTFSCRAGICGTCLAPLAQGTVEWTEEPLIPPPEGEILLCCTRPKGPVTLEL